MKNSLQSKVIYVQTNNAEEKCAEQNCVFANNTVELTVEIVKQVEKQLKD